jgi:hypothetical protein
MNALIAWITSTRAALFSKTGDNPQLSSTVDDFGYIAGATCIISDRTNNIKGLKKICCCG